MPYKPLERQYRAMATLAVRAEEEQQPEESYIVEGYATTFDVPYEMCEDTDGNKYYECIARTALDHADMSDVIMQFDHTGRVFARQSNGTLTLEPDEHGLHIRADLSSTESSRELYNEIKAGLITKMSWAFIIQDGSYDDKTRTYTIKSVSRVFDVSAVSIPADADTEIAARHSLIDGEIEKAAEEFRAREAVLARMRIKLKLEGLK